LNKVPVGLSPTRAREGEGSAKFRVAGYSPIERMWGRDAGSILTLEGIPISANDGVVSSFPGVNY
jgi:hypothetical protein